MIKKQKSEIKTFLEDMDYKDSYGVCRIGRYPSEEEVKKINSAQIQYDRGSPICIEEFNSRSCKLCEFFVNYENRDEELEERLASLSQPSASRDKYFKGVEEAEMRRNGL